MIALYLLAAHMVGDFVLQTRWQSAQKFDSVPHRMRHVAFYSVPFYAVLAVSWPGGGRASGFLLCLMALHFLTDSRRFRSTLGDVVAWKKALTPAQREHEQNTTWAGRAPVGSTSDSLPPNPWQPIALMIDQTLHVVQLAVLGGIFLA